MRLSIVLLTFNRWDCTVRLLESLRADGEDHTQDELIWIDNGSVDATRARMGGWIVQHGRRFGRIMNRLNVANVGYIIGVNQGMMVARGEYVCLLNNDTVVSEGWVRLLLTGFDRPEVGAIGPVSNGMPWSQHAEPGRAGYEGVEVLYGFCIVVRRTVLDTVGLLDERYGRGVVEVEDWCERMRRGGMELVVCHDVLVRHDEPHASYAKRTNGFLHIRNKKLFALKWGYGPHHWGDRSIGPRSFRNLIVEATRTGETRAKLESLLSRSGQGTEIMLVERGDSEAAPEWRGLVRAEPRTNVVRVRDHWVGTGHEWVAIARHNSRAISTVMCSDEV